MHPGDRLICLFIEPVSVNEQFRDWPLHVIIVPWFKANEASNGLVKGLGKALKNFGPLRVTVDKEARFGYRKSKPVNLLLSSKLEDIEKKTRSLLHLTGAKIIDETTKIKRSFRPHVTFQKEKHLREGDTFVASKLYIVEQKGDHKQIVGEVLLQS